MFQVHSVIPIWFPGKLRTTQCASILQCQFSLTEKEKDAEGTFRLRNRTSDILETAGLLMSKNCRSTDIPEEYGEGSKVLKACKPPSLVEYEQAKEGGDSKVGFLDNLEFQCVSQNRWQDHLYLSSKVKEAIKRVKKEGLKASASIVKKEKMRYCLVLIQVFVL